MGPLGSGNGSCRILEKETVTEDQGGQEGLHKEADLRAALREPGNQEEVRSISASPEWRCQGMRPENI